MIIVWNRSKPAREIFDHVGGQLITVPAGGYTAVTERKAEELLKQQRELCLVKPGTFSEAEIAGVAKLAPAKAVELAQALMRGDWIDRAAMFAVPAPELLKQEVKR